MAYWFRGKRGGLILFLAIAGLVIGGLGWVTAAALRLEREQVQARADAELYHKLRLALWRLDSYILNDLEKETGRPFSQYRVAGDYQLRLANAGKPPPVIAAVELQPLPEAEPTRWVSRHFIMTLEADSQWLHSLLGVPESKPKAPAASAGRGFKPAEEPFLGQLTNDLEVGKLLAKPVPPPSQRGNYSNPGFPAMRPEEWSRKQNVLKQDAKASADVNAPAAAIRNSQAPAQEKDVQLRQQVQEQRGGNYATNNVSFLSYPGQPGAMPVPAIPGPMIRRWLTVEQKDQLVVARVIQMSDKQLCQLALLDWAELQKALAGEIEQDLFTEAQFRPVKQNETDHAERTLAALPVELDPGPLPAEASLGWTPLRIGLALAWAAALIALAAVGVGGWSLIDLSERRVRFVSAVTHELRTPLTTLRLYLDMLTGGLVKDEKQKAEYLQTLNSESDRLNRLVGNVLDFSRLENQRPRLEKTNARIRDVLEELRSTWQRHCEETGKELIVENTLADDATIHTNVKIVQQILGNLIDNACKYTRDASDQRIWLRAQLASGGCKRADASLIFEVEDRGPGVAPREQRTIFQAFRRGQEADVTAGGVGLGLALARRWARLLGGEMSLQTNHGVAGACFRLKLPMK